MKSLIKCKFLLFSFCISLILIAIITTMCTLHARSKLIHQQLNKLTVIAESKRLHVRGLMELQKARTADFSTDWFIRSSFEKVIRGGITKRDAEIRLSKYLSKNKLSLYRHLRAIEDVHKHRCCKFPGTRL